jgi:hypothetical protein
VLISEGEVWLHTAGVLPGLARWSTLMLNGMPNELVDVRTFSFTLHPEVLGMLTRGHSVCRGGRLLGNHILELRGSLIISGNGQHTSFDQVRNNCLSLY